MVARELITSRRNSLIRQLRDLQQASGRHQQQRLLLEGTHLLQEALRLHMAPDLLLATPQWIGKSPDLIRALPTTTVCREATPEVMEAAASTRHPDGVLSTVPWKLPGPPLPPLGGGFGLLLQNVQDPGNLGTLLRTALAAGVDQVWLVEGADPWQPKVLRASSGASLALAIERMTDRELPSRLTDAKGGGTRLFGTVVRGGGPYWGEDWQGPILLMLGNEAAGLTPELAAAADALLSIPISPRVESLNVAVAAAPLLLERQRQQLGAGAQKQTSGP